WVNVTLITMMSFRIYAISCPVLECWFVHEKGRGGLTSGGNQEKTLLYISTDEHGHPAESQRAPSDANPDRVFFITDPAGTLCQPPLNRPSGSAKKPQCEINPFLPHPSDLKWVAALTESTLSPYTCKLIGLQPLIRTPNNMILSVTSTTIDVQARLGEPVQLDCSFWVDPSSPLSGSGFAVEWRYQFRGDGRLVLAYDGKMDRVADIQEEGATLDFEGLHEKGNASLILQEAEVRHSGMYICTVYLPYLVAQVAVETPTLSIYPSPLPLTVPGQTLIVQCEAWEFKGTDGKSRPLGSGSVTGHRQAWDGTFSQSSRLELDTTNLDLGRGGEVTCVGVHPGGTRRASVTLNVIGFSTPSVEDSMAMVGVALVLYGLIKLVSWTFTSSGSKKKNFIVCRRAEASVWCSSLFWF
uniref:Ig-like domain-containing protein n=1 Tax=Labrus bergylta TaxID=56723 RepID=A0A3Q3GWC9_9LABR